jgi:serine protease Do
MSLPDIASVVDSVSDAVVSIKATSTRTTFFGMVPQEGEGSGFIIDDLGHVVTNAHVVGNAQTVTVTLPNDRVFPDSVVVGTDAATDLAVIRIEGSNLPVVQISDTVHPRVGSWVVAIGNAIGLRGAPTVTAGIISAVGRKVPTSEACPPLTNLIQTDAAINPGNSGGPLFDLNGHVVGINTAVQRSTSGGIAVEGVGFAISIRTAIPIIEELIEHGVVEKPWIGVGIYTVTSGIAARFRLRAETGVLVNEIFRPEAERAGLRPGQVITQIDGVSIRTVEELLDVVGTHEVGDQVVIRGIDDDGDKFTRRLTLGQKEGSCAG